MSRNISGQSYPIRYPVIGSLTYAISGYTYDHERFTEAVKGKYMAKGYRIEGVTNILFVDGLHLITSIGNTYEELLNGTKG